MDFQVAVYTKSTIASRVLMDVKQRHQQSYTSPNSQCFYFKHFFLSKMSMLIHLHASFSSCVHVLNSCPEPKMRAFLSFSQIARTTEIQDPAVLCFEVTLQFDSCNFIIQTILSINTAASCTSAVKCAFSPLRSGIQLSPQICQTIDLVF